MSSAYIDDTTRRKLVARWIVVCLVFLHAWATFAILAVVFGKLSDKALEILGAVFSTATFGIGATLVILLFDRAADAVIAKITGTSTKETTQTTRIIEPAPGGVNETAQPGA